MVPIILILLISAISVFSICTRSALLSATMLALLYVRSFFMVFRISTLRVIGGDPPSMQVVSGSIRDIMMPISEFYQSLTERIQIPLI